MLTIITKYWILFVTKRLENKIDGCDISIQLHKDR